MRITIHSDLTDEHQDYDIDRDEVCGSDQELSTLLNTLMNELRFIDESFEKRLRRFEKIIKLLDIGLIKINRETVLVFEMD